MNLFKRAFYGVVGLTGFIVLGWTVMNFDKFLEMGFFANITFVVGVIAMVNWGAVAVTGDEDILGLVGL